MLSVNFINSIEYYLFEKSGDWLFYIGLIYLVLFILMLFYAFKAITIAEVDGRKTILNLPSLYKKPFEDCKAFLQNADTDLHCYEVELNKGKYFQVLDDIDGSYLVVSPNKRYIDPKKGIDMTSDEFRKSVSTLLERALKVYRSKYCKHNGEV